MTEEQFKRILELLSSDYRCRTNVFRDKETNTYEIVFSVEYSQGAVTYEIIKVEGK